MAADCRTPPFLLKDPSAYEHCVRKRAAIMLGVVTIVLIALGAGGLAHIKNTVSDPEQRRSERQRVLRNLSIAFGASALLCFVGAPALLHSIAGMQRTRYETLVQQGVPPPDAAARVQGLADSLMWMGVMLPVAVR